MLKDHLQTNESGQPVMYAPYITAVKNGQIAGTYHMDKRTAADREAGQAAYWTEDRTNQSVQRLQSLIQKLN